MAKPEWGTKRTCPKCGERFYDLGNADPIVCIACETEFKPEPILKTKQPIVLSDEKEEKADETDTDNDDDDDLDIDDESIGDVSLDDDDDDEVSTIVDTSLASDDS
ncbi:TIGR02300 family protein [Kordiimonas pumila]|uniref:TIGR02300 family protein n=1 Tax=Kordiimonas pumila TaxID=2161677 RepID=A0ABV7D560_9PROT|nr:TIGR02300 family protein [Kordiimonas pumila]